METCEQLRHPHHMSLEGAAGAQAASVGRKVFFTWKSLASTLAASQTSRRLSDAEQPWGQVLNFRQLAIGEQPGCDANRNVG